MLSVVGDFGVVDGMGLLLELVMTVLMLCMLFGLLVEFGIVVEECGTSVVVFWLICLIIGFLTVVALVAEVFFGEKLEKDWKFGWCGLRK